MRVAVTSIKQRRVAFVLSGVAAVALWTGAPGGIIAQSVATPVSFTSGQADQGRSLYVEQCASCHGQYLDDGQFGPPLKGVDFRARWSRPGDPKEVTPTLPPREDERARPHAARTGIPSQRHERRDT